MIRVGELVTWPKVCASLDWRSSLRESKKAEWKIHAGPHQLHMVRARSIITSADRGSRGLIRCTLTENRFPIGNGSNARSFKAAEMFMSLSAGSALSTTPAASRMTPLLRQTFALDRPRCLSLSNPTPSAALNASR
jgi:hypothetical protein